MIRVPFLPSPSEVGRPAGTARPLGLAAAFTLGLTLITIPAVMAEAQDQAAVDRLVQLNKKAMDDYDTADFDVARKSLLDAEKLGKRAGLDSHPVMARTYVHLGALYWIGYKDAKRAQAYFDRALEIQPDIKLDKNLTSTSLRQLFAKVEAQRAGGGAAAAAGGSTETDDDASALFPKKKPRAQPEPPSTASGPPSATEEESPANDGGDNRQRPVRKATVSADVPDPDLPASIAALDCPYPDETPLGKKVVLRCVAAPKLKVAKVLLFYRGFEMSSFETVEMARSPKGWWQATVPKKRVDGKSLQFYFEGMDTTDRPVVSNGRAESPNVMLIVEGGNAAPVAASGSEAEENPLDENGAESPRLVLGRVDRSRVGLDTRYGNRRYWIGVGVGTGEVYAINGVPESRVRSVDDQRPDQKVTGFGWAGLGQLVPEIGVMLTPDWAVTIESRHQWIPQDKKFAGVTASGAHAVLVRGLAFTKQNRFRQYFGAAAGGGEGIRMNIFSDPNNSAFKDTILVGRVLVGGTAGLYYELSRGLSWVGEINALVGFPKAGIGFDFNTALQFNFGDTSGRAEKEARRREDSVSTSVDDEDPK